MRRGGKLAAITMSADAQTIDRRPGVAGAAATARSWFKVYDIGVATISNDSTRIDIYEEIGGWGMQASDFVAELRAVQSPTIDLHINSPGGSVFDGVAIYNALSQHPAQVNGFVDGLAASAASFIAQACDTITMNPGSMMMVHDAIGMTWGNALDHTTMAALLAQVSDSIADLYAARAGGTAADWRGVMENNGGEGKWYTAREAVAAGLADKVAGDPEPGDSVAAPATAGDAQAAFD
ncbi:MAG: head maturation protease, ClpP-related, partial [Chloroflexota bacterium]